MLDIIDFFFYCLNSIWSVITQFWLLSMSFLILILGWVISLINGTSRD